MQENLTEIAEEHNGLKWLRAARPGKSISEFGGKLASLLDEWEYGIYHIQKEVLHKRVDWASETRIEIVIGGCLCTYDSDSLTRLVFLCHEYRIRCEVIPQARNYLMVAFSPRKESGRLYERHPGLLEAVSKFTGLKL
jgi:hypothetical protein